jgi:CheY-like chemotaxis protein
MSKLKVAVLEDVRDLLEDLIESLKETGLVEVLVKAMNSNDLLARVREEAHIDLLILDIDLGADSRSGIDVARKLKMPVLFVSGNTKENLEKLEELNLEFAFPVEHIMKPVSVSKLNRIIPKLAEEIRLRERSDSVTLLFSKTQKKEKVDLRSVVFIKAGDLTEDVDAFERTGKRLPPTLTNKSASGNKVVFFIHRKPEMLTGAIIALLYGP